MSNFVLIHGAGTGAWLWESAARMLRDRGHQVLAPTLIGVGERASEGSPGTDLTTHIEQVVDAIVAKPAQRWVVVGFSYGGLVAAGAVNRIPEQVTAVGRLGGLGPAGKGVDIDDVRRMLTQRGTHPIGTYREPAAAFSAAAKNVNRFYVACGDRTPDDPMTQAMHAARAAGMPILTMPTGHFPMLTMPHELADLLTSLPT